MQRVDAATPMDASPPAPMLFSPPPPAWPAAVQEPVVNPNTRVRSGSPDSAAAANGGASPPRCQLEYCRADLTSSKAYFRRHKVCWAHSRAPKTLVASTMQRFCQHCSRFHLLAEFDGSKRSCRRRLAAYYQGRARTRPAFVPAEFLLP